MDADVTTVSPNATTNHKQTLSLEVYLFLAFMLPVCFVIVAGNSLVLIAPWKFTRLRKKQHVFLMNVAVADLATGLLATPVVLVAELKPLWSTWFFFCVGRITIVYICASASNLLLLAATIERYMAIHHPFSHEKTCTPKVLAISCAVVWLYASAIGVSVSLGWNNWSPDEICFGAHVFPFPLTALTTCQALVVMVVIAGLYARIFHTAQKQARRIAEDNMAASNTRVSKSGLKAAKVTAMVVLVYMICFVPYVLTLFLQALDLLYRSRSLEEVYSAFYVPGLFTAVLLYLNAGTNPVIYHGVMPNFRAAVKSLLGFDRVTNTRVSAIDIKTSETGLDSKAT